jgi:hypothetical protein
MGRRAFGSLATRTTLSRPWPAGETEREGGAGIDIAVLATTEVEHPDGVAAIAGTEVVHGTAEEIGTLAESRTAAVSMPVATDAVEEVVITRITAEEVVITAITAGTAVDAAGGGLIHEQAGKPAADAHVDLMASSCKWRQTGRRRAAKIKPARSALDPA